MRRHQKSTLKEVAHMANVSATTVSLFASGHENVCAAETAERIREAIKHLHYTPNSLSRSLRTRATQTIGIAVARPVKVDDPRYSYADRLFTGIDAATDEADYLQLYYPASVRMGSSLDRFLDGRIDGLLTDMGDSRARGIANAGMPVVMVGRGLDIPEDCGAVYADEWDAMTLGLTHLWDLGHRRIAHIAGPCKDVSSISAFRQGISPGALMRRVAFSEWLAERGVYDPELVVAAPNWLRQSSSEAVIEAIERWWSMAEPPTALFCANDAYALVAVETLMARGLNVPRDVSVIGIDNQFDGMLAKPALTTITVPAEEIGEQAVRVLLKLISGANVDECRVVLPVTELNIRETTAPVKDALA